MRVLIEIEYKGTNYCGWQIQPKALSIQQILQDNISLICNQQIKLVASGRTDSGVHAKSQYAHFDYDGNFDVKRLPFALQNKLPNDISIKNAWIVRENFHARYSVMSKTYYYRLFISNTISPLKEDYYLRTKDDLDIEKMQKACKKFVGTHDFSAFCLSRKIENENNVRTINLCLLEQNENELIFKICGNGFLHNMVRIIVGTLLEIGTGRKKLDDIERIFQNKDRTKAGKTVSAKGLMLMQVDYGLNLTNSIIK